MNLQEISASGTSDRTAEPVSDRTRRLWQLRQWLGFVVFLAVVFAAPAVLLRAWQGSDFDQAALDSLNRQSPEIVFIGNSMLETRIDPEHLSSLLGNREVASLAVPGSQSAIWYLQLKNLVAATDSPPELVFVFFRNDLITQPLAPLDHSNRKLAETLVSVDEKEYESVLESNRSFHQKLLLTLEQIYPIQLQNGEALDAISDAAAVFIPASSEQLSTRADDQFAFHNLRETDEDEPPPEAKKAFGDSVEASFLPLMLRVAADNDISLVFVRVQARPNLDGTARESDSLASYSQDLASFLRVNSAGYIDFSGNPAVDRAFYYDSFHIRQRYLLDYTELFLHEAQDFLIPEKDGAGQGG